MANPNKKERMEKRMHIRAALKIINQYYPEGLIDNGSDDDLNRIPEELKHYIRSVMNAENEFAYRPELEEDTQRYWAKNKKDKNVQQTIIDAYIQGYKIHELSKKFNWPATRVRDLLREKKLYVRNRYIYILTPLTDDQPMLAYDTLKEVCEVLKISPSTINEFVDTEFKNWYITRRDLVKELYTQQTHHKK